MENWTHSRNIVLLDEFDDSKVPQIGNNMDLDKFNVIKHNGIFFAFLSMMDNLKISVPVHNHLSWSRDNFDCEHLPERPLFIENGQPGEWDDNHIGDMLDIMPEGDRLRIYYRGGKTTQHFHGREGEKNISGFNGTGLAFIGKDRFIGLQEGSGGGYLLTRQFILEEIIRYFFIRRKAGLYQVLHQEFYPIYISGRELFKYSVISIENLKKNLC